VSAGSYAISISGTTLARNLSETMALAEEILLEPRWDEEEFERVREEIVNGLRQQAGQPTSIASNTYRRLIYGDDHIYASNIRGSIDSLSRITIEDLQRFYEESFTPSLASIHLVGDVTETEAVGTLAGIGQRWMPRDVAVPEYDAPEPGQAAAMYFVDVPGASQSVIAAGRMAMAETDGDFYPATMMNLRLGGMFTSRLNQTLREERGYTYGASSGFSGSLLPGPFTVSTSVRSNVTMESVDLIRDLLSAYPDEFDEADLDVARGYLLRSNALAFETLGNKITMLRDISVLGLPADFVERREQVVREMTVDRARELAREYADPETMIFLIVGDRETQMPRLGEPGVVEPVLIEGVEP
jgi:zinc protease